MARATHPLHIFCAIRAKQLLVVEESLNGTRKFRARLTEAYPQCKTVVGMRARRASPDTPGGFQAAALSCDLQFDSRLAISLATFDYKLHLDFVELLFETSVADPVGLRVDARLGRTVFEVLSGVRDARRLRMKLLELAQYANASTDGRAVLILDAPTLTTGRVLDEWNRAVGVFRPEVGRRLGLVIKGANGIEELPTPLPSQERAVLEEIINNAHSTARREPRQPQGFDAFFEVLKVLLIRWTQSDERVPIKWLLQTVGITYPTAAAALRRLDNYVERHSDRGVSLRHFPKEPWEQLVALAERVRGTVRFADISGAPRSVDYLAHRLRKLGRTDVAIAGLSGARHYCPSLDILGNPVLVLSMHVRGKPGPDLQLIHRLDPGLKPVTRFDDPASVVLHQVKRAHSLFSTDEDGTTWADPVECLLDLHEARLEPQALQFFHSLRSQRS